MISLEKDLAKKAANQSFNEYAQSQNVLFEQPPISTGRNKRKRPAEANDEPGIGPTSFAHFVLVSSKVKNFILI